MMRIEALASALKQINIDKLDHFWRQNVESEQAGEAFRKLLSHAATSNDDELLARLVNMPGLNTLRHDDATAELLLDIYFRDFHDAHEPILEAFEGEHSPRLLAFFTKAAQQGPRGRRI